ncbi:recombinase family protein, partial [Streptomyces sp. NPDC019396]|uniref:recombinase family protein n=1 Tax=Streptomyces sp. NPDC019396 TaxID=3154687 RepID=UPI00340541B5
MTTHKETVHDPLVEAGPECTAAAVVYVCAVRSSTAPTLAEERAEAEGMERAVELGLRVVELITDEYGTADPGDRDGWRRVRALAESGDIVAVIVRWPTVIAPESVHELRYREIAWLRDHGVRVCYSW